MDKQDRQPNEVVRQAAEQGAKRLLLKKKARPAVAGPRRITPEGCCPVCRRKLVEVAKEAGSLKVVGERCVLFRPGGGGVDVMCGNCRSLVCVDSGA